MAGAGHLLSAGGWKAFGSLWNLRVQTPPNSPSSAASTGPRAAAGLTGGG